MSKALEAAIEGASTNGPEVIGRLWGNDLIPADILRSEIEAYASYVQEKVPKLRPFVDTELAVSMGHACMNLLDTVGENAPEEHRRLVQLAGLYLSPWTTTSTARRPSITTHGC
jgi:hypothetical protein